MFRYTKVYLLLDLRNTPTVHYTKTNRTFTKLSNSVYFSRKNRFDFATSQK